MKFSPHILGGGRGGNRGFTLVELLVAISILATISIVGYVSFHSSMMKANNSRRITSMDSLKGSINNYYQIKKTLPDPNTNRIYYDEKGTYVHSSTGSFGVSGHASRHWYSEDYANNFAFDPDTKQFFGYGKLSDNSAFDIATALYVDTGIYKAYVDGTYDGGRFPSLVRAYHSSDFVVQDSTEFLPYNPLERKVTAKIVTWSGTVSPASVWIGSMNETTCTPSPTATLTGELMTGDCIQVGTGSTALLHISDGSELSLGSTGSVTILELKDLRYKDSEDPVTSVLLKLMSGEVWAEAPRLRKINENESEMQIYTTTALAAVRGTVFGVSIDSTGSTILSLASGEIEVGRNPVIDPGIPLFGDVSVSSTPFSEGTDGFSTTATGGYVRSGSTSSMIVPDGGKAISLTVPPTSAPDQETHTGSIDSSTLQQKLHFLPFGMGYIPRVISITTTGSISDTSPRTLVMRTENPGADWYTLSYVLNPDGEGTIPINSSLDTILSAGHDMTSSSGSIDPLSPIVTLSGSFANIKGILILSLCKKQSTDSTVCSHPLVQRLEAGELTLNHYGDTMRVFDSLSDRNDRVTCPDGQRKFGELGCQPKELVAFAPYDAPGDIVMYDGHRGSLGFSTNRIVGSGSYAYNTNARYTLNAIQGFTEYKNSCVPVLNTSTMAFASATCSTNPTIDLINLASKGFRFDVPNSFFDIPQVGSPAVRGVLVENNGNTDYLKYDLSTLELGDKFSIEVSVRGAALKRSSCGTYCRYHLFEFKDRYNNLGVYLSLYDGNLILGKHPWNSTVPYMDYQKINSSNLSLLDNNKLYKIIASFNNGNWNFNIDGINSSSLLSSPPIVSPSEIFIGSRQFSNSYDSQWNDIIDYTKIYKLK